MKKRQFRGGLVQKSRFSRFPILTRLIFFFTSLNQRIHCTIAFLSRSESRNTQKSINYLSLPSFSIYFSPRSSSPLNRFVDRRWRSSRAARPARASHSRWLLRDLVGVSCVSRSQLASSGDMYCVSRSSPEAHGSNASNPRRQPTKSRLSPISSSLPVC